MKLGSNIIPFSFPTYSFKLTHYSNTVLLHARPLPILLYFRIKWKESVTRITIYDLVLLPYSFLFYNTNWLKFINKSKMIHLQAFAKNVLSFSSWGKSRIACRQGQFINSRTLFLLPFWVKDTILLSFTLILPRGLDFAPLSYIKWRSFVQEIGWALNFLPQKFWNWRRVYYLLHQSPLATSV